MKPLLKQMFTWIGVACTAGTIVISVIFNVLEPSIEDLSEGFKVLVTGIIRGGIS